MADLCSVPSAGQSPVSGCWRATLPRRPSRRSLPAFFSSFRWFPATFRVPGLWTHPSHPCLRPHMPLPCVCLLSLRRTLVVGFGAHPDHARCSHLGPLPSSHLQRPSCQIRSQSPVRELRASACLLRATDLSSTGTGTLRALRTWTPVRRDPRGPPCPSGGSGGRLGLLALTWGVLGRTGRSGWGMTGLRGLSWPEAVH